LGEFGGAVGGSFEKGIAHAAPPTMQKNQFLPFLGEVGEDGFFILVQYLRADRDAKHDIGTILPASVLATALLSMLGFKVLLIAVVNQGIQIAHRDYPNLPASSAVAAIGATIFNEFLTPEADTTRTTIAALDKNFRFIEEFHVGAVEGMGRGFNVTVRFLTHRHENLNTGE
jgi:hypothetical protein